MRRSSGRTSDTPGQRSIESFLAFASNEAYLAGMGHRNAAVEDARPLPLSELPLPV